MKTLFRRITSAFLLSALLLGVGAALSLPAFMLTSTPVSADSYGYLLNLMLNGEPAGRYATDDTDVAIILKYVGAQSGTVAVAAGGDITFKEGASGSETASASFECPVSGALGGVIDVSDSACDTLGEVVDTINGSCTGCLTTSWRAVILDGLRADSSNDTLLTFSETASPTANAGMNLLWDTSTAFMSTVALTDCRNFECGYIMGTSRSAPPLVENPWNGRRSFVWYFSQLSTYGSGDSAQQIISVDVKNKVGEAGSETATVLWQGAGGASTTASTFDARYSGFPCKKNQKCIVRLLNSAAASVVTHSVQGTIMPTSN
jgi:hypothetical protein